MTSDSSKEKFAIEEALHALYGEGLRDLSPGGYGAALGELRKVNPNLASRAERVLEPYLAKHVFPRRRRQWHDTSEGMRARLELLPGNPHFDVDVKTVREALGIPKGQTQAFAEDSDATEVAVSPPAEVMRRGTDRHLAGIWMYLHKAAAQGDTPHIDLVDELRQDLRESAVASAQVRIDLAPVDWLRETPRGPAPYDGFGAPLEWATGRLIERHRLPWKAAIPVMLHVLTLDPAWITELEPLHVDIIHSDPASSSADPESFTVSLKGIDEYVTREDWERVWTDFVHPWQEHIWSKRGGTAKGRRRDVRRLREFLPVYRDMVGLSLSKSDVVARAHGDSDQETIRRAMSDLQSLLRPTN